MKINSKKNNTYFAFIAGLLIVYFFVFIKTLINIDEELKFAFKSKENYLFHKKYSRQIHHIRDESALDNMIGKTTSKDLLFSNIYNDGKKTILFQGDSWINQIGRVQNKRSFNYLREFGIKKNINIKGAGIASYSPSLMNLQLDLLENDFNIKPTIIVAFINQLDFGDELCRYKNNKIYINGKFEKIKEESNYEGVGWYNYTRVYGISEINFKNESNFIKTFNLINFKLDTSIKRIFKRIKRILLQKKIEKKCYNNQIERYLIKPDEREIKYFESTIIEYLEKIDEKKHVKNIVLVTFPLKKHFISQDNKKEIFKYNIAQSVNKIILNKRKVIHLDFSDLLLNHPNFDHSNIWAKDEVHLNPNNHSDLFIKNILKEIDSLL
ncbi:MAG: hypothetical protein CBE13_002345 [Candidatus Pelagibacter sp. TMED253]|nr:MAG: hypothetical protein CBE13_002345 [Candidatus Pelagibacter sp. TMED253]